MKFYYNGQLVRTSKTHHYTHAIIRHNDNGTITCMGCSSSQQGAEKLMNGLWVFKNYRMWKSVQDGTYKPKDRWAFSLEKMRTQAPEQYGSVDGAVKHYQEIVSRFEIVEVEEA